MKIGRRTVLKATTGAVASTVGMATAILANTQDTTQAQEQEASQRNKTTEGACLLTLQLKGIPADALEDDASARKYLEPFVPIIAQEMVRARSLPRSRGCSVSGSASTGPGGTSGSVTVTCTFGR